MEEPLAMVTEMGVGSASTLERQAVEEGKKWPVVPVSAIAGAVGGSTGVGLSGSTSLKELW
jgi:hypothetical protein